MCPAIWPNKTDLSQQLRLDKKKVAHNNQDMHTIKVFAVVKFQKQKNGAKTPSTPEL